MEKEITWNVEGSDVTHTIPVGASVTFSCSSGEVTIQFDEEGGKDIITYTHPLL